MKERFWFLLEWLGLIVIYYPVALFEKIFQSKSQKEDTETVKRMRRVKEDDEADLVSEFIDLMIRHGVYSKEVEDFMRKYRGDKEFHRKLKLAIYLKLMYERRGRVE